MALVTVFSPHFDDESIGCGGTIAQHILAGDHVSIVFMTAGNSASILQPQYSQQQYGQMRKAEASSALKVLGVPEFECLELDEGFMRFSVELDKGLISIVRKQKPDIVYIPHAGDDHNDHMVTNAAVRHAVDCASWRYFPHLGLSAHQTSEVRAYEVWTPLSRPNLYIDVSETMPLKLDAIQQYRSQSIYHDFAEAVSGLNRYRAITASVGRYAEAFFVEKACSQQ